MWSLVGGGGVVGRCCARRRDVDEHKFGNSSSKPCMNILFHPPYIIFVPPSLCGLVDGEEPSNNS